MNKRDNKKIKALMTPEFIEAWANWEINDGSVIMNREDQQSIKDMAIELLKTMEDGSGTMEIYETKLLTFSGLCCKIQMRNNVGVWQQRHIWYPPTPHVTSENVGPWIRSIQIPPGKQYHLVKD